MRRKYFINILIVTGVFLLTIIGCKKAEIPVLTTTAVIKITDSTAVSGGFITWDGGAKISARGVCWSTDSTPSINNYKTTDSVGTGSFSSRIYSLDPGIRYYLRAYATNSAGTGYGKTFSFITSGQPPKATTQTAVKITAKSATLRGIANANYLPAIVSFEYGTTMDYGQIATASQSPVKGNTNVEVSADISDLKSGIKYYFRVKAVNVQGTAYGDNMIFSSKLAPAINNFAAFAKNYGDPPFVITSPTSNSNGTFTYRSSNKKVATISDDTLTIVGLGTSVITATQEAAGNFASGNITTTLIANIAPAITGFAAISKTYGEDPFELTIPTSNSTGFFVFISRNPGVATINGRTVTILGAGTSAITALQAPSGNYGSGMTTTDLIVSPGIPVINNFAAISRNYGDHPFEITSPTSNSNGTFTYRSSNEEVATISDDILTIRGTGTATITATQAAAGNYTSGSATTSIIVNLATDLDGNTYNTEKIGNQIWMKENLKVTKYLDGSGILNVRDNKAWITQKAGAYCWYNNDSATYKNTNGALYNGYVVIDQRNICPTGFHIPDDNEWDTLGMYLGVNQADTALNQGKRQRKSKITRIWSKDNNGNDASDFSNLAGLRYFYDGMFYNVGIDGCWWSSTETDVKLIWIRNSNYYFDKLYPFPDYKNSGFSIRCIKDH